MNRMDVIKELLAEYTIAKEEKYSTCAEFVAQKLAEGIDETAAKQFVNFYKHAKFIKVAVDTIYDYNEKCKFVNKCSSGRTKFVEIILYLIIFELHEGNINEIKTVIISKWQWSVKILNFFMIQENVISLIQRACSVYDNEFVSEKIVNPLVRNIEHIKTLRKLIVQLKSKTHKPIITNAPACYQIKKLPSPPPPPAPYKKIKPRLVPLKTYTGDWKLRHRIRDVKADNRENALKLYETAMSCSLKCAEIKPKKEPEIKPIKQFIHKPAPKPNEVKIKTTNAALMREAAVFIKVKEEECKKLDDLINGAFDSSKAEAIEIEIRLAKQQSLIQDIERKHLQGLLTYEEAILAKKKLLKSNQLKMVDFQKERFKLLKQLQEFRNLQETKNKELIDKAQMIEEARREAEVKLKREKRCNAKLLEYETKKLLQEAYERRQEELRKKMELIQELKALQQLNLTQIKEFDRTECSNLGLLCEMSIAELQERLNLLKCRMKEDLDDRRKKIAIDKRRQDDMMEDMKKFIVEARKAKPLPKKEIKLEHTADLDELRRKLEDARNTRLSV